MTSEPGVRDRVLTAAVELFAAQGYDGTSVAQVTERARVAKGGFYHHFASKQELLYAVYGDLITLQLDRMQAILDAGLPPAGTLRALIDDLVITTAESSERALVSFREIARLDGERGALLRTARRRYHDAMIKLIRDGQADGSFARVASPETITFTIFGVDQRIAALVSARRPQTAGAAGVRAGRVRSRRTGRPVMGWGLTIPLTGLPLPDHAALIRALPGLGYTDVWSSEVNGADAFTPLALASAWEPSMRLGTAIVPAFTRGPALIAMSAATMAAAAPDRFVLGLGSSSPAIVGDWNGFDFTEPYRKTRDVLRFVRLALAGERVDGDFDTFTVHRFKLDNVPSTPPPVLLAALRPQMLRLAGTEADGVILNWLAATDVAQCLDAVGDPEADVVARVFVCPTEDVDFARNLGRMMITSYLTVPAYAAFHEWLGRGPKLGAMWDNWAAGDRKAALAAVPDDVIDELILHGSPQSCRQQLQTYADAGVRTPVIALLPTPELADPEALVPTLKALGS